MAETLQFYADLSGITSYSSSQFLPARGSDMGHIEDLIAVARALPGFAESLEYVNRPWPLAFNSEIATFWRIFHSPSPEHAHMIAERMVARFPETWQSHDALGHARSRAGDPLGAIDSARRAFAIMPDNGGLAARLGRLMVQAGDHQEGLSLLLEATRLWDDWHPWLWLAETLYTCGRAEEARESLLQAARRTADHAPLVTLARLLDVEGVQVNLAGRTL